MKGDRFKAGIGGGVDPDGDPSVAETVSTFIIFRESKGVFS